MSARTRKIINNPSVEGKRIEYHPHPHPHPYPVDPGKRMEYQRSLSQGNARRWLPACYFSLESLLLLVCLTASLLILPLVLPPLPPPPFLLLLLPIGILLVLLILAFMPSNKNASQTFIDSIWSYLYKRKGREKRENKKRQHHLIHKILHASKNNKNAKKALIVAEYAGVQVELAPNFEMDVSNKTPEFLKINPIGKMLD